MSRVFVFALALLAGRPANAEDLLWKLASSANLDCAGEPERVFVARDAAHHYVRAEETEPIAFGLEGDSQDSLCGQPEPLEIETLDYDVVEILGEEPEGFRRSAECQGLVLRSGDCDSFHLYWNHVKQRLDWWRL